MAFVELRGARLFFTDEGGPGSPMLFVHGFSCDSHDWSWQLPAFERRHRVIAYDLRGHGRSSDPAEGYGILSLAADAIALVEHLECAPVTLPPRSESSALTSCAGSWRSTRASSSPTTRPRTWQQPSARTRKAIPARRRDGSSTTRAPTAPRPRDRLPRGTTGAPRGCPSTCFARPSPGSSVVRGPSP